MIQSHFIANMLERYEGSSLLHQGTLSKGIIYHYQKERTRANFAHQAVNSITRRVTFCFSLGWRSLNSALRVLGYRSTEFLKLFGSESQFIWSSSFPQRPLLLSELGILCSLFLGKGTWPDIVALEKQKRIALTVRHTLMSVHVLLPFSIHKS